MTDPTFMRHVEDLQRRIRHLEQHVDSPPVRFPRMGGVGGSSAVYGVIVAIVGDESEFVTFAPIKRNDDSDWVVDFDGQISAELRPGLSGKYVKNMLWPVANGAAVTRDTPVVKMFNYEGVDIVEQDVKFWMLTRPLGPLTDCTIGV